MGGSLGQSHRPGLLGLAFQAFWLRYALGTSRPAAQGPVCSAAVRPGPSRRFCGLQHPGSHANSARAPRACPTAVAAPKPSRL